MSTVFIICTLLTVLATLLPLSRNPHWIVRGLDFPRLQIMTFAFCSMLLILFSFDVSSFIQWALLTVLSLCAMWQLWWILPYTWLWRKEVRSCSTPDLINKVSIVTSNILTSNKKANKLIELIQKHKPDILITLESDTWWEDQLAVLESDMPYTVKCPLDNLYGMHLYSKLPLHNPEIAYLVEQDVPSIHAEVELRSGQRVRMHFIHPAPPSPTENEESSERDAELIVVAKSVAEQSGPVIVTGDLNDVAWSSTTRLFRKISGLLDPRIGRGFFNTFHASFPFLRWPLDHLFHSKHFTLAAIKRLPSIGSDHFPLFASLVFNPLNGNDTEGLTVEAEDLKRATRIKNEMDVDVKDVPGP